MKQVISTEQIPIKLWLDDIEDSALEQAKNLANLPFVFKHIAIMPDSHLGYGMPIGGVMATKGVIIPNAVGVDIGCGMIAVKTSLTDIDADTRKKIMGEIREVIPLGFNHQKEGQDMDLMPSPYVIGDEKIKDGFDKDGCLIQFKKEYPIVSREFRSALQQIGTLGGGNHFIEIQKGSDGHIWIMIHSGSRNIGLKVASHYNKLAIELNEKWHSSVPKNWELAYLPMDSDEGKAYIREMNYCVDFALTNRELMMYRIKDIFAILLANNTLFETMKIKRSFSKSNALEFEPVINIAHNYARMYHYPNMSVRTFLYFNKVIASA